MVASIDHQQDGRTILVGIQARLHSDETPARCAAVIDRRDWQTIGVPRKLTSKIPNGQTGDRFVKPS
jgi:hypothetical protein